MARGLNGRRMTGATGPMNALVRAFGLWATFILSAGAAISQASVTGGEVSGVFVHGIASKDAKESRSSETRMEDFPMRL